MLKRPRAITHKEVNGAATKVRGDLYTASSDVAVRSPPQDLKSSRIADRFSGALSRGSPYN